MAGSTPLNAGLRIKDRLQGLEWLRAIGAVLVVILHAGIPYLKWDMPGLVWPVHPLERSATVNALCWGIDAFIMPLFILMSGYFAARLFKQRGADSFLKHRLARLGGPLLLGIVFILPLDLYAWLLGWVVEERLAPQKLLSLKIPPPLNEGLWGVSHLWFLEFVLTYCVIAWIAHRTLTALRLRGEEPSADWTRRLPRGAGYFALGLGTLVCGLLLWRQPRILLGFRHGWLPHLANLLFFAVPFTVGWFWERSPFPRRHELRDSLVRIAAACLLLPVMWPGLEAHLTSEAIPTRSLWFPLEFAACGLLLATGLFGFAKSLSLERAHPAVSYVAKASFWIYLLHHPLVGLAQVALADWPMSGGVECALVTTVVLALCLLTYEAGVRRTWLGLVLNGVRESRVAPATAAGQADSRRQAA